MSLPFPRFLRAAAKQLPVQASFFPESTVELVAKEKESDEPDRFKLLANTGIPMEVEGFYLPVILDLPTAKFAKKVTPIIADHDNSIASRIGHTELQEISDNNITATAIRSSSTQKAQGFITDLRAGFPFQVSVGASLGPKSYILEEDQEETINGRSYKGPLLVAKGAKIKELTVTVLGADDSTRAIAAKLNNQGESTMNPEFKKWLEAKHLNADTLSDEAKASLKAMWEAEVKAKKTTDPLVPDLEAQRKKQNAIEAKDTLRKNAIRACVKKFNDLEDVELTIDGHDEIKDIATLEAHAIEHDWPANIFELHCRRNAQPKPTRPKGKTVDVDNMQLRSKALAIGLLRSSGKVPAKAQRSGYHEGEETGYECMYSERELEAADKMVPNYMDLHYLMLQEIEAARALCDGEAWSGSTNTDAFVKAFFKANSILRAAGHSTHSVSNVLADAQHKNLLAMYQIVGVTWPAIVGRKSLNDFKTHNFYRLDASSGFTKVSVEGVLPHMVLTDAAYTVTADTRGQTLTLTRKQMRNDDLDALNDAVAVLGQNAALSVEEEVWDHILTARGNYTSPATEVDLDIDGLIACELAYRNQVDGSGKPIIIPPDRIFVGNQDAVQAKDLFATRNLMATNTDVDGTVSRIQQFAENPMVGKYTPYVSPYISNTSIKKQDGSAMTNQDANQWFMACNPAFMAAAIIGFLDGKDSPYLESDEMPFEYVGGMRWKAYFDFGIGAGNTKAIVASLGTA